jgi:hypothetical protein
MYVGLFLISPMYVTCPAHHEAPVPRHPKYLVLHQSKWPSFARLRQAEVGVFSAARPHPSFNSIQARVPVLRPGRSCLPCRYHNVLLTETAEKGNRILGSVFWRELRRNMSLPSSESRQASTRKKEADVLSKRQTLTKLHIVISEGCVDLTSQLCPCN